MNVVFRADASILIGTGHVMRCLTLADELSYRGHHCTFICRELPGHLGELVRARGHGLLLLPAPAGATQESLTGDADGYAAWLGVPWDEDARQTTEALSAGLADWLIVDHYALDARWEKQLSPIAPRLLAIDDLANRKHSCHLLLDQNLGRQPEDYDDLIPEGCQRLIGPRYGLLRPEFANLRKQALKRRTLGVGNRVLVSLGGIDRHNVTGQILKVLFESAELNAFELDVVMGGAAPHLDAVRYQLTESPVKATLSVDVKDMAHRMYLADWSIGAPGGTSWERCCLGLPTLLVVLAENQASGGRALESAGAGIVLSGIDRIEQDLPVLLTRFNDPEALKRMSLAAAAVADGEGVTRILDSMKSLVGNAECPKMH